MKKYRIKNYKNIGYKVQKRELVIFWSTFTCYSYNELMRVDKIYETIEEAREFIKQHIKTKKQIKESKYTEYL